MSTADPLKCVLLSQFQDFSKAPDMEELAALPVLPARPHQNPSHSVWRYYEAASRLFWGRRVCGVRVRFSGKTMCSFCSRGVPRGQTRHPRPHETFKKPLPPCSHPRVFPITWLRRLHRWTPVGGGRGHADRTPRTKEIGGKSVAG